MDEDLASRSLNLHWIHCSGVEFSLYLTLLCLLGIEMKLVAWRSGDMDMNTVRWNRLVWS